MLHLLLDSTRPYSPKKNQFSLYEKLDSNVGKLIFAPYKYQNGTGVYTNATVVCINATGVYTDSTGVLTLHQASAYFFCLCVRLYIGRHEIFHRYMNIRQIRL